MYRYFLHNLSDWPIAGACNAYPFGPDGDDLYLATLDASDPHCAAYELGLAELTQDEAQAFASSLVTDTQDLPWNQ